MGLAEVSSSALYDNNRHINQRENVSYGNNLTAALNDSRVKYDILYTGDLNHNITQEQWDSYDNGDCCGEAGAERMVRQRMADRLAEQYGGSSSDWYDILMAEDAEAGMKAGTEGLLMIGGEALVSWVFKGLRALWLARGANYFDDIANIGNFADEIIRLNKATDGGGVLLNGNPTSAINSALYYGSAAEQGASIFRSISHGHMFMNGNKRTAVSAFQAFAKYNGLKTVSQQQMLNIANQVSKGVITDVSEIARMLIK